MANKLTQRAGLEFNVNAVKSNMVKLFENRGFRRPEKDEELDDSKRMPMFSGSQVAVAAMLQRLCTYIVENVNNMITEDKSKLRTVHRSTLKYSIGLDKLLEVYYETKLSNYDQDDMYAEKIPISKKEMETVISQVSDKIKFTPQAYSMLCFLLYKAYTDITTTAHQFIRYAKRKTLDARSVMFSVETKFTNNLAYELRTEIERAVKALGVDIEGNGEELANDEEADAAVEDVVEPVSTTTKGKKQATKAESKVESKVDTKKVSASTGKKSSGNGKKVIEESSHDDDDDDIPDEPTPAPKKVVNKKQPVAKPKSK